MDISVIVAHDKKRDPAELNRCLVSINKELDQLSLEDVSSEVIVEERGSCSEARNLAADVAKGKILVFVDDDAELRPGALKELLAPFDDKTVGIVGGVNVAFPEISVSEQISASMMASPLVMFKSAARYTPRGGLRDSDESELLSAFMAVRSSAFNKVGGFPEDVIPCEENVLINRVRAIGWRVIYNPFAVVYHKRPRMLFPYLKTVYHYGYGRGLMMRKLGKEGRSRVFWRPSWRWPVYVLAYVLHVACYLLGLAAGYWKDSVHKIDKSALEKLKI